MLRPPIFAAAAMVAAVLPLSGCSNPKGHLIALMKADAKLTVYPVRSDVYWVKGGLSNSGFIVGDTGVVVIDAEGFAKTARNLQAKIAAITPQPVNAVILTHSDPDHVNGISGFPKGIQIIAQENLAADVREALKDPRAVLITPPETAGYLPTRTVSTRTNLVLDGVRLELLHVAPAHTDSDLIIFAPDQRVVFAGDILVPEVTPYAGVHREKRGSIIGWMATMSAMLDLDADTFIAGHGDPMSRADVERSLQATKDRYGQIEAMVARRMSVEAVKAALKEPKPKGVAAMFPTFVETAYAEIVARDAARQRPDRPSGL